MQNNYPDMNFVVSLACKVCVKKEKERKKKTFDNSMCDFGLVFAFFLNTLFKTLPTQGYEGSKHQMRKLDKLGHC